MSLQNLVHPLHANLADLTSGPMHIIGQVVNDPWYTNHELRLRNRSRHDNHDEPAQAPDFDARESDNYFFLEGELAGIASKEDLNIEWIGHRTLLVEAIIPKVDEEAEWEIQLQTDLRKVRIEGEPGELERPEINSSLKSGNHTHRKALRVWMNERHTGALQKSFTFPCDVDTQQMRARLTNGLVKILVPKLDVKEHKQPRRIDVEG